MFAFRRVVSKAQDRESLRDKIMLVPEMIVDSLIARFTERTRDSTKYVEAISNVQVHQQ
jgi:hypothetical protein